MVMESEHAGLKVVKIIRDVLENKDKLEVLSNELLQKEIITEDELKAIMEEKNEVQN